MIFATRPDLFLPVIDKTRTKAPCDRDKRSSDKFPKSQVESGRNEFISDFFPKKSPSNCIVLDFVDRNFPHVCVITNNKDVTFPVDKC